MPTATKTRPPQEVAKDKATVSKSSIDLGGNQPAKDAASKGASKITSRVREAGGLLKITLGDLRDELGFSRLGRHVLGRMAMHLSVNNLGFFPTDLLDPDANVEPRQWQELWVFIDDGSARAEVLKAIGNPEEFDLVSALDNLEGTGAGTKNYSKMTQAQRLAEIARLVQA